MSEVVELKKLVKDLQSATTVQVCQFYPLNVFPFIFIFELIDPLRQERVSILQLLKKNFQVNEAILRVGISFSSSVL